MRMPWRWPLRIRGRAFSYGAFAGTHRRDRLVQVGQALHERGKLQLRRIWDGLRSIPGVTVYGPPPDRPRTPTVSFAVEGRPSRAVAEALAERAVFVSDGDFYATTVVKRLGHESDGLVRAGCAAYTTVEEVDRLVEGVRALA